MKIINEAQKQISLKQTSDKHEKFIFITQIMKIYFSFKYKFLGICMIYPKLIICIHISNIQRVHNINCMKANDSKGIHVYLLVLNKKLHIHEANHTHK